MGRSACRGEVGEGGEVGEVGVVFLDERAQSREWMPLSGVKAKGDLGGDGWRHIRPVIARVVLPLQLNGVCRV